MPGVHAMLGAPVPVVFFRMPVKPCCQAPPIGQRSTLIEQRSDLPEKSATGVVTPVYWLGPIVMAVLAAST